MPATAVQLLKFDAGNADDAVYRSPDDGYMLRYLPFDSYR